MRGFTPRLSGLASFREILWPDDPLIRRRIRQQFSVFLISAGVSLVLLTAAAYHWMYREQQGLIAQSGSLIATGAAGKDLTLLSIPRIGVEAAVLEGTGRRSLLLAPGHLEKTAWPGAAGNSVIAGHRDTFFRRLNELQKGDDLIVTRGPREYHYTVTSKSIVAPSDISVTLPSADTRLTLVTCYPTHFLGPAPKRLIVVAKLQPASPSPGLAVKRTSTAVPLHP